MSATIAAGRHLRSERRGAAQAGGPLHVACYMHSLAGGGVERMRLHLLARLDELGVRTTLLLHTGEGELGRDLPPWLAVKAFESGRTMSDVLPLRRFCATSVRTCCWPVSATTTWPPCWPSCWRDRTAT